ncbi:MAG: glycosyltransferase family 4 protein [candidate division Zixibacteria bacterium]|nr:glycosyltransferase family 4 protein [candidate division Zixibacteria bacterium]
MRILIVTQYFPPERGAVRRLFEFAKIFKESGHKVTILTAMPNYPDGILPDRYRRRFFVREKLDGLDVARSYVLPASNTQPTKRMIGFVTFLISSVINSFRLRDKYDLIIASSPPVTTALVGYILSRLRGAKFVLEIRDLQPESGVQFGNLKESFLTRLLSKLMTFLYRKADRIVCVTDGINSYLKDVGTPADRLVTIKSGVGSDFIDAHSNGIRKKFGWGEKFLVVYSGTLGWVRPLETIVESARILADREDIHFVFVGDGQKKEELENLACKYNLTNITFVGLQPLEDIPFFLRSGNALVECLKNVDVAKLAVPTKLFEYMAAGKPILLGCPDGEAIALLKEAGGSMIFPTDNPSRLAELILELHTNRERGEELGRGYRSFIKDNHSRRSWAERYLESLENVRQ